MGFYRGPQIVTSGLVLHLDAANPKSYPGTGSTWYDRSGNLNGGVVNNGTLVNGPSFSSTNMGSIGFDGVNDYISLSNIKSLSNNYTLRCVFKTNTNTTSTAYFNMLNGLSAVSQNSMKLEWNNRFLSYNNSGTLQSYAFAYPLVPAFNLSQTFNDMQITVDNSNVMTIYNNAVPCTPTTSVTGAIDFQVLGRAQGAYLPESIAIFQLYNRALSATEVLQNYNATKSRFT